MTNTRLTSTHLSPLRPTIPLWIVVICAGRIRDRYDRFFSFLWTLISWLSPRNVFKWEKDTAHARRNLPLLSKAMTMWTATLGSHSQLVVSTVFSRRATGSHSQLVVSTVFSRRATGSHSQLVVSIIFSRRATMPNMSVPVLQVSIILHAFFRSLSFILISLPLHCPRISCRQDSWACWQHSLW